MKKHGFTLAEIMIVLSVIAILTAILLPAAFHATPNEDVMKFKKAHNTLYTVVRELVTSDKYYLDGDLGISVSGQLLDESASSGTMTQAQQREYFCNTFADVISTRSVSCTNGLSPSNTWAYWDLKEEDLGINEQAADNGCKASAPQMGSEIISSDGIHFYRTVSNIAFGTMLSSGRKFSAEFSTTDAISHDSNGFPNRFITFCIDIDGIPSDATAEDCVNECPFGYGIRADGKIYNGARAQEWLERSIQDKEEEYGVVEFEGTTITNPAM